MGGGSTRGARVPTPKRLDVGRFLICRKITKGKSSVRTVERGPTTRERPKRRHEKGSRRRPTRDATDEQEPLVAQGTG